jgi:hypothetical protein
MVWVQFSIGLFILLFLKSYQHIAAINLGTYILINSDLNRKPKTKLHLHLKMNRVGGMNCPLSKVVLFQSYSMFFNQNLLLVLIHHKF